MRTDKDREEERRKARQVSRIGLADSVVDFARSISQTSPISFEHPAVLTINGPLTELRNFRWYTFQFQISATGEESRYKIWHHPGQPYRDELGPRLEFVAVEGSYTFYVFEPKAGWATSLRSLFRNWRKFLVNAGIAETLFKNDRFVEERGQKPGSRIVRVR